MNHRHVGGRASLPWSCSHLHNQSILVLVLEPTFLSCLLYACAITPPCSSYRFLFSAVGSSLASSTYFTKTSVTDLQIGSMFWSSNDLEEKKHQMKLAFAPVMNFKTWNFGVWSSHIPVYSEDSWKPILCRLFACSSWWPIFGSFQGTGWLLPSDPFGAAIGQLFSTSWICLILGNWHGISQVHRSKDLGDFWHLSFWWQYHRAVDVDVWSFQSILNWA